MNPPGRHTVAKETRYETVTPTWEGLLPAMLAVLEGGSPEARSTIIDELRRMARIADSAVARRLAEEAEERANRCAGQPAPGSAREEEEHNAWLETL